MNAKQNIKYEVQIWITLGEIDKIMVTDFFQRTRSLLKREIVTENLPVMRLNK